MSDYRPNEESSVATEAFASVTPSAVGTVEFGASLPDSAKPSPSTGKTSQRDIEFRVRGRGVPTRRLRLSGSRYTIGSGVGCSIRLDDPALRPLHAVLIRDSRRILVRAYSVPVAINGNRIMEGTLEPGDEIQFGAYRFELLSRSPNASDGVSQSVTLSSVANNPSAPDEWQEQMRSEAKRWRQRLQELQQRDGQIREREQELEDRGKWLQDQQSRLEQREDELTSQEHAAIEVQAEFQRRYEELEQAQLELLEQRSQLESQRADVQHRQDLHAGRDKQSEERIAQLIAQQREFDALQSRQREEMQTTSEQLARARHEAEEATDAVRRMHQQMSNLNAQLDQLGGEQSDLREKHRAQLKGFRIQSEELTNQLADADENRRQALEELAETRVAHEEALQTIDRVSAQLGDAIEGKTRLQTDLDKGQTDLEDLQSRYETLHQSHESLHDTHEALHATHEELTEQHRTLSTQHADACVQRDALMTQVDQLEADLQAAKTEAESLQRDCQMARESVEELQSLNRETLDHQDTERQRWESELSQLRDQVDELSQQLTDAEGKLAELRNENGRLSQQLASSETERDILSEDLVALKQANEETIQERDSFRSQVYSTESELGRMRRERDQAKQSADSAREMWDHSNRDHDDTLDRIERIEQQTRDVIAGEADGPSKPPVEVEQTPRADLRVLAAMPEPELPVEPESAAVGNDVEQEGAAPVWSNEPSEAVASPGAQPSEPDEPSQESLSGASEEIDLSDETPGDNQSTLPQDSDVWPTYDSPTDPEPEPAGWAAPTEPAADADEVSWLNPTIEAGNPVGAEPAPQSFADPAETLDASEHAIEPSTPSPEPTLDTPESTPPPAPTWATADANEAKERLQWNAEATAETAWHAPEVQKPAEPEGQSSEEIEAEPDWSQTQPSGWNTASEAQTPDDLQSSEAELPQSEAREPVPYETGAQETLASELVTNEPTANEPTANEPTANEPTANEPTASESASSGLVASDFESHAGGSDSMGSLSPGEADVYSEPSQMDYQPIDPWATPEENVAPPVLEASLSKTGALADQLLRELREDETSEAAASEPLANTNWQDEQTPAESPQSYGQTLALPDGDLGRNAEAANESFQETPQSADAQHTSMWNQSLESEEAYPPNVEGTLPLPENGLEATTDPDMSVTQSGFEGPSSLAASFDVGNEVEEPVNAFMETAVAPEPDPMLTSLGDVEATIAEPEVTAAEPVADSTEANVSPDDDSIEAYMNRLLQRVGGSDGESSPATPAASVTSTVAAESQSVSESTVVPDPVQAPEPEPPQEPIDPDAPLVPRSQAPERNRDLSAMRELANQSARSAISKSAKFQSKHTRSQAMVKFASAGIAIACGLAAFALVQGFLKAIAAVAALIIAGVYVKEGFSLLTTSRNSGSHGGTPAAESDSDS